MNTNFVKNSFRAFLVGTVFLTLSPFATAVSLIDTFLPNNGSNGSIAVVNNPAVPIVQSIGLRFAVSSDSEVTDVLLALTGTGSFRVGVQGSILGTNGALLPSSTFLYSQVLVNPTLNAALTGLAWDLTSGSYFLVAEPVSTASALWGYGAGGATYARVNSPQWFATGGSSVAARINAVSPIPEPSSVSMLLAGVLALGMLKVLKRTSLVRVKGAA